MLTDKSILLPAQRLFCSYPGLSGDCNHYVNSNQYSSSSMCLSGSSHDTVNSELVYIPQMLPDFLGEQELGKEFRDDQFTWGNSPTTEYLASVP